MIWAIWWVSCINALRTHELTLSHGLENSWTLSLMDLGAHKLTNSHGRMSSPSLVDSRDCLLLLPTTTQLWEFLPLLWISHTNKRLPFFYSLSFHCMEGLHGRVAICVTFPRHTLRVEGPACSQLQRTWWPHLRISPWVLKTTLTLGNPIGRIIAFV